MDNFMKSCHILELRWSRRRQDNWKYLRDVSRGWDGVRGWGLTSSLGLQNQWSMRPKCYHFENCILIKTVTPEISAMPQRRNYNEVPFQSVCLFFFQIFTIFSICFFFPFQIVGEEWLAARSTLTTSTISALLCLFLSPANLT